MTMLTEYLSMTDHGVRGVHHAQSVPALPSTDEDREPQAVDLNEDRDAPAVLQL
jgi:hypothetical protein